MPSLSRSMFVSFVVLLSCAAVGCGGGGSGAPIAPGLRSASEVRTDGLKKTFAGKNRCNAKDHDRPFIIEWDATDSSSFESRASGDVVFVRYTDCELEIVDQCSIDSVRGSFGSYRPVEWTSGSVESIEIADEGDLFAKLPLGAAALEARVQGGEKFALEYFVAGTRMATRDTIDRTTLSRVEACKRATHFVYSYNLGAFALLSRTSAKGSLGGTVMGVGAGGSRSSKQKADKSAGLIGSCRGASAKEVETCKAPIRLTLRAISDGAPAAELPETPRTKSLAAELKATTEKEKRAVEHARSAQMKANAKDGPGCLAELDAHDKLDPRPSALSTNVEHPHSQLRAKCLMLAGQCPAGKILMRKAVEKQLDVSGPGQVDYVVDHMAATTCRGNDLSDADKLGRAANELNAAAVTAKDVAYCKERIRTIETLLPSAPASGERTNAEASLLNNGPACLGRAGDCNAAWAQYEKGTRPGFDKAWSALAPAERERAWKTSEPQYRAHFQMVVPSCRPGG
jgi:hypothetical protein